MLGPAVDLVVTLDAHERLFVGLVAFVLVATNRSFLRHTRVHQKNLFARCSPLVQSSCFLAHSLVTGVGLMFVTLVFFLVNRHFAIRKLSILLFDLVSVSWSAREKLRDRESQTRKPSDIRLVWHFFIGIPVAHLGHHLSLRVVGSRYIVHPWHNWLVQQIVADRETIT